MEAQRNMNIWGKNQTKVDYHNVFFIPLFHFLPFRSIMVMFSRLMNKHFISFIMLKMSFVFLKSRDRWSAVTRNNHATPQCALTLPCWTYIIYRRYQQCGFFLNKLACKWREIGSLRKTTVATFQTICLFSYLLLNNILISEVKVK